MNHTLLTVFHIGSVWLSIDKVCDVMELTTIMERLIKFSFLDDVGILFWWSLR